MRHRVAIPTDPFFERILRGVDAGAEAAAFDVVRAELERCGFMLRTNQAILALVSPRGYAVEFSQGDYRLIPGPALLAEGYTGLATVYFKQGLDEVRTCATTHPGHFLVDIGTRLLAEKFDILAEPVAAQGTPAELLEQYDAVIDLGHDRSWPTTLDVTEEWSDLTNMPLVLGVWACRPSEIRPDIASVVSGFAAKANDGYDTVISDAENAEREPGSLKFHWEGNTEDALNTVIDHMFYWQMIDTIADVKIWGRDEFDR